MTKSKTFDMVVNVSLSTVVSFCAHDVSKNLVYHVNWKEDCYE